MQKYPIAMMSTVQGYQQTILYLRFKLDSLLSTQEYVRTKWNNVRGMSEHWETLAWQTSWWEKLSIFDVSKKQSGKKRTQGKTVKV